MTVSVSTTNVWYQNIYVDGINIIISISFPTSLYDDEAERDSDDNDDQ